MTIKYAVLEHLYLPDRGLRFWTTLTEDDKDPTKLSDGRTAFKVIKITEDKEEAKKLYNEVDWNIVHEGEYEFHRLCTEENLEYPLMINDIQINNKEEKINYLRNLIF